jgi:hypothetical protein
MNLKTTEIVASAISVFGAAIFSDSLRYKFTDHPKTQEIFGRLNDWAASLGADGLFAHHGLFSQYVIGSAEAVAAVLLIAGLLPVLRLLNGLGAVIAFGVMSGAVSFHLFTPLGIDPNNDGGGLFAAAVTLWIGSAVLIVLRRDVLLGLVRSVFAKRQMAKAAQHAAVALAFIGAIGPAFAPSQALADKAPVWSGLGSNAAIRGYDPVAYFTANRPTRGDARYFATWNGARWHFASAANRAAFVADPTLYAPQYGGYCAWAVSQGYTAGIDPNAWRIVNGKLYLNYNRSIQERWEQNIPGNIAAANRNWPSVLRD